MKLLFKNISIGLLMALVLLASVGISFCKVSCSMGQRYVIGSEMPTCNKGFNRCCKNESDKNGKQNPKDDNRKKETFYFKTDFKTYDVRTNKLLQIKSLVNFVFGIKKQELTYSYHFKYKHYRINPPPLLWSTSRAFLQTFLI
jgi:hypothetical protein